MSQFPRATAVVVIAAAVSLMLAACAATTDPGTPGSGSSASSSAASGTAAGIAGLRTYSGLTREHVTGHVAYPQTPPVGGNHEDIWAQCDGQVSPVPLPNERAVHSLEHGAVWITYQPVLPADQVAALAGRVRGVDYTLMSPYPGQSSPITLTAWGLQVDVPTASDPRIDQFIRAYRQGPQTPEPGARCDNPQVMTN